MRMKIKTQKNSLGGLIAVFLVLTLTLSLTLLVCPAYTAIPQKINYQGYLTNSAGVPVSGTEQMVFSLYDVASGGSALWTETRMVTVTKGVYNVTFGEVTVLGLDFSVPYYLGVQVGTDPEMSPRIPLTSAGYAFRAQTVESVGSHTHSGADITSGTVSEPRIDPLMARDSEVTTQVNAHASRTDNPHSTTAAQVGAAPAVHGHNATDITSGTLDNARFSAYSDLSTEGYLDNNAGTDLLTRAQGDGRYVNVTGDTMTGALNLPANGLAVGTNQLIVSGGGVGVGTATPNEQLEITGNLRLPETTATTGIIKSGTDTLIHTYGTNNFFSGINAGNLTNSGGYNTAVGWYALRSNTSGSNNAAFGGAALSSNTTGNANTAGGNAALGYNTTGYYNTAIGSNALFHNTTANKNTALGNLALYSQSFDNSGTPWDTHNTAVGFEALFSNEPTSVGNGQGNTALGSGALRSNTTGHGNTATGIDALYSNTTGILNTASGQNALYFNTEGVLNTATGYTALYSNITGRHNTAVGRAAGYNNETGNRNVFLGNRAGYYETGSDRLHIANSENSTLIYGRFDTGSVCIDCTDPSATLDVNGPVRVRAAQSYLWISGNGVRPFHESDSTVIDMNTNGGARVYRGATAGYKNVMLPITITGPLFGQDVTVTGLDIYWAGDTEFEAITAVLFRRQTGVCASCYANILFDTVDHTCEDGLNPTGCTLHYNLTSNNTVSGVLYLTIEMAFSGASSWIDIGGARLTLRHD